MTMQNKLKEWNSKNKSLLKHTTITPICTESSGGTYAKERKEARWRTRQWETETERNRETETVRDRGDEGGTDRQRQTNRQRHLHQPVKCNTARHAQWFKIHITTQCKEYKFAKKKRDKKRGGGERGGGEREGERERETETERDRERVKARVCQCRTSQKRAKSIQGRVFSGNRLIVQPIKLSSNKCDSNCVKTL